MKTPRTPTDALTKRIVKRIKEGIPPEIAARLCGVPFGTFCDWMQRGEGKSDQKATLRYKRFAQAIDMAEAESVAAKITALNRAIKRDRKVRPILWWLERRDAGHFPATKPGVTIGGNLSTTIVQQIAAVTATAAQLYNLRSRPRGESHLNSTFLDMSRPGRAGPSSPGAFVGLSGPGPSRVPSDTASSSCG